jgi:hypothetical protein
MPTGHDAPWQANDAYVVAEVLAAELRADTELLGEFEDARFEFRIADGVPEVAAFGWQRVEIAGGRQLGGLQRVLGRRTADHDREVVRRARRGPERAQLLVEETHEAVGIEERLRLLEQVALVG